MLLVVMYCTRVSSSGGELHIEPPRYQHDDKNIKQDTRISRGPAPTAQLRAKQSSASDNLWKIERAAGSKQIARVGDKQLDVQGNKNRGRAIVSLKHKCEKDVEGGHKVQNLHGLSVQTVDVCKYLSTTQVRWDGIAKKTQRTHLQRRRRRRFTGIKGLKGNPRNRNCGLKF